LVKSSTGILDGSDAEPESTISPASIMHEIAKAAYLEDVLFGKTGSIQRLEVRFNII
jgi:hypothetical protein